MTKKLRLVCAASTIALGAFFSAQPLTFDANTLHVTVSRAFAIDVGVGGGGTVGAEAGGSLGGGVSEAAGAVGGAVSGGAATDVAGGVSGSTGSLAAEATSSASGAASATASTGGFLDGLFGRSAKATADASSQVAASAAAAGAKATTATEKASAKAAYEQAVVAGKAGAAADALVQLSTKPVTEKAVRQLNASLRLDADAQMVTAVALEAKKIEATLASHAATKLSASADRRGTQEGAKPQTASTNGSVEATASYEAAMLQGDFRAAAEAAIRLSGRGVTEARVRELNAQAGIEASDVHVKAVVKAAQQVRVSQR